MDKCSVCYKAVRKEDLIELEVKVHAERTKYRSKFHTACTPPEVQEILQWGPV